MKDKLEKTTEKLQELLTTAKDVTISHMVPAYALQRATLQVAAMNEKSAEIEMMLSAGVGAAKELLDESAEVRDKAEGATKSLQVQVSEAQEASAD